jgi:putative zinc finger protein
MSASQPHPSREDLFAYRDGELKHDRRVIIEAHVLGCHVCRELIDDVSRMEADLSAGAPVPKDSYFERLSEQVMVKVAAADTTPSVERRRPDAEVDWEEQQALKPKLPWFAIASTASAAATVIVVGVLLIREGAVWRRTPPVAVLERSAPDAARSHALSDSASKGLAGGRAEGNKRADAPAAAPSEDKAIALQSKIGNKEEAQRTPPVDLDAAKNQAATEEVARQNEKQKPADEGRDQKLAILKKDSSTRLGGTSEDLTSQAPSARAPSATFAEPVGGTLKSVLDRFGLPPVWGPGVSDDQVLRAEPALRNLYRVGGASGAADSARVRLYLAEAARVRAGASPDSAAIDEIVHHYRRAIRLAGSDAALRDTATERLQDFLNELGDEPALHSP